MNLSVGDDEALLEQLADLCGADLLNLHSDRHHNRSVFTLLGTHTPRKLAAEAVDQLDLDQHTGVHPRIGVVDVVPFVPLGDSTMAEALGARDNFARFAADDLNVPVFFYGEGAPTLPLVRRRAWNELEPDLGPKSPHPSAGAMCVGAREILVAYNVWLVENNLELAKSIARQVRGPYLRSLGLQVGERVQVSMNLIRPDMIGPMEAFDQITQLAAVAGAELVGLVPETVLLATPRDRWEELDLSRDRSLLTN